LRPSLPEVVSPEWERPMAVKAEWYDIFDGTSSFSCVGIVTIAGQAAGRAVVIKHAACWTPSKVRYGACRSLRPCWRGPRLLFTLCCAS